MQVLCFKAMMKGNCSEIVVKRKCSLHYCLKII